jgi:hypothetical protein
MCREFGGDWLSNWVKKATIASGDAPSKPLRASWPVSATSGRGSHRDHVAGGSTRTDFCLVGEITFASISHRFFPGRRKNSSRSSVSALTPVRRDL